MFWILGSSFWTCFGIFYRMFINLITIADFSFLSCYLRSWSAITLLVFGLLKSVTTLCYDSAEIDSFCRHFAASFTNLIDVQIFWNFGMLNFYLLTTDLEIFSWFHWKTNAQQFFKVQSVFEYVSRIFSRLPWFMIRFECPFGRVNFCSFYMWN